MEQRSKQVKRARDFSGATAINTARHYYVQWRDFEDCLDFLLNKRKWLLITGPFQSGKSSLAYALAQEIRARGLLSFVTTLTIDMVQAANDTTVSDMNAMNSFFALMAEDVEEKTDGLLQQVPAQIPCGMTQLQRMLRKRRGDEPDVVWLIDEAGLLTEITRPSILRAFLCGLRTCKEESRADGTRRLRSFCLVGTARTGQLLASPRLDDPYAPFPPGYPISPLSMEIKRGQDFLTTDDILFMLRRYSQEHGVPFSMSDDASVVKAESRAAETERGLTKLAVDIYELTSGYKGLVGSCCEYIQANAIRTLSRWKQDVRRGSVASHIFDFKVYSRIASNIPNYSPRLQGLILDCVYSPTSGLRHTEENESLVLPALNDGVLSTSDGIISLSSPILLSAILQSFKQATEEEVVAPVATFEEAVRQCFRHMNPDRLSRDEVLNHNGQPSEYIWQFEFLLALKLMLAKGYHAQKYTILVECRKKDKNGQRRMRLEFYLKSAGSTPRAFEVQAKGGAKTIKEHIQRSDKYRKLFAGCEMNYIYFVFGKDAEAKQIIRAEGSKFPQIRCWFVEYLNETKMWNVELLQGSGWHSVQLDLPSSYPQFKFGARSI